MVTLATKNVFIVVAVVAVNGIVVVRVQINIYITGRQFTTCTTTNVGNDSRRRVAVTTGVALPAGAIAPEIYTG